jgi:hypothetical protein
MLINIRVLAYLVKISNIKFHENPSRCSGVVAKVIVTFGNFLFANVIKKNGGQRGEGRYINVEVRLEKKGSQ